MRCAVAIVVVSVGMLAQSAPPACPADRPVDDIIAEIQKQQSKRKHRNPNPLPEVTCIFGWCRDHSRTPKTIPEPAPRAETPGVDDKTSDATNPSSESSSSKDSIGMSSSSSSKHPNEDCDTAMEAALSAAHNVEVGDTYFEQKSYRPALLRYNDALEEKPRDAAIYVRLGRVLEKLNDAPRAIEHYKAAQELGGPEKWTDEAKRALARLQRD